MVVVVKNESDMASYFPEAGNLNGSNDDMGSDVAGWSSSGSSDSFEFSDMSNEAVILLFPPILALLAAILEFERDYNSHIAFGACYINMYKAY